MNKTIIGLSIALIMAMGLVSATGFSALKHVDVTGDWAWDGDSWTLPNPRPVTATYDYSALSAHATSSYYHDNENLGEPWKYALDMGVGSDSSAVTFSDFNVITVNDPRSTPATGGFTQAGFHSESHGVFSSTSLTVVVEGYSKISTSSVFDGGFTQLNQVRVNEETS